MIDIYEYLKKDHKKVADLFEQFTTAKTHHLKIDIVAMIVKELTLHAHSEQETFYKAIEKTNAYKEDISHAEKEHADIEAKINEIADAPLSANKSWDAKVLELKLIVEHHVKEEEGKIFSDAKKVLTEEQAYILKEKMHDYKEKMLQTMEE